MDRRTVLKAAGVGVLGAAAGRLFLPTSVLADAPSLPQGTVAQQGLEALPGKKPLIRKTFRPPNYETPVSVFDQALTPNDSFFVRYHLSDIPEVDVAKWTLKVGGAGAQTAAEYKLDDLRNGFPRFELVAVCQCSGNRRGFSDPHVAGVEWGYGAMGNARWAGVRLRDVLAKAGVKAEAIEVSFGGADGPPYSKTPDYVKSVPVWKANDENTLIAFEMNGQPLPHWNGFPARLVVPGWTGTYWMKHLTEVSVLTQPLQSFWMTTAYRIPRSQFPVVERFVSQEQPGSVNTPITEMVVNSLITNLEEGQKVPAGSNLAVRGIAWDGGFGIAEVAVSIDNGATWKPSQLGTDMGRFSWRQWTFQFAPASGAVNIMVRARNNAGQTQVDKLLFNGPGYHNNVIQKLSLTAA
jgi:sulfite dehydrogenase